jgi:hypothetical protein
MAAKRDQFPGFDMLGPRMFLYVPSSPKPGHLIILCTWLGALKKHIMKYTSLYQSIAPNAKILLIESDISILTSTYSYQHKVIQPAVEAIQAVLDQCETSGTARISEDHGLFPPFKILLHVFSGGGLNSATQLLIVLHGQRKSPLPLHGIMCDSGPAKGEYWKGYNSLILSLPKSIITPVIGPIIAHVVLIILFTSIAIGRYEKPESLIRRTLLDENIVDLMSVRSESSNRERVHVNLCYLVSKADKEVDWRDVAEHADLARRKGYTVKEVIFEDAGHCSLLPTHRDMYVDAVKEIL